MSSNFRYYRYAAKSVAQGWTQWDWRSRYDERCLVQVLRDVTGRSELPLSVIAELDGELDRFKDYRLARIAFRLTSEGEETLEALFMLWNDAPWRRKQDVLSVLNALAYRLEAEWKASEQIRLAAQREADIAHVTAERDRLESEVKQLAGKVQTLQARVTELEEENGFLRRLSKASALRADRQNLQELSDELDTKYKEIDDLPEVILTA
jgi:FtsZ-binding cell division protein ZapB